MLWRCRATSRGLAAADQMLLSCGQLVGDLRLTSLASLETYVGVVRSARFSATAAGEDRFHPPGSVTYHGTAAAAASRIRTSSVAFDHVSTYGHLSSINSDLGVHYKCRWPSGHQPNVCSSFCNEVSSKRRPGNVISLPRDRVSGVSMNPRSAQWVNCLADNKSFPREWMNGSSQSGGKQRWEITQK